MSPHEPFTFRQPVAPPIAPAPFGARHFDGTVTVPMTRTPALTDASSPAGNRTILTTSATTPGCVPWRYQTNPVPFSDTQIANPVPPPSTTPPGRHQDNHLDFPTTTRSALRRYQTNPVPFSDTWIANPVTSPSDTLPAGHQDAPHRQRRSLPPLRAHEIPNEPSPISGHLK